VLIRTGALEVDDTLLTWQRALAASAPAGVDLDPHAGVDSGGARSSSEDNTLKEEP
jgi:hypothetical protein